MDSNTVYVTGYFETILKTTNSGQDWIVIKNGQWGQGTHYMSVFFINQNTGWISGGGEQKILKTTNGGNTFDSIVTLTSGFIEDIYFCDTTTGLYCDDNGHVRKTTNGGFNWFSINIPVGTISYTFRNFTFVNQQSGWVLTSSGNIYKTSDFGSNWNSISTIQNGSYPFYTIFFSSFNTGYSGGAGNYFYRSTNRGYNWMQQYLPYPINGSTSIFFINDTTGWKVANSGRICYTSNGGQIMHITNNTNKIKNYFILYQNYPNPFNPFTKINYDIPKDNLVCIKIYDILGREIKTLVNDLKKAGSYIVSFNGSEFASGVYFYRIQASNFVSVKRMVLIK